MRMSIKSSILLMLPLLVVSVSGCRGLGGMFDFRRPDAVQPDETSEASDESSSEGSRSSESDFSSSSSQTTSSGQSAPAPSASISKGSGTTPVQSQPRASEDEADPEDVAVVNQFIREQGCIPPNESEYDNGDYTIGWSIGGDRYEGLLDLEGRVGRMRISYFDATRNGAETVDQTMIMANCPDGLVLLGVGPTYAETGEDHPNYSPDNLIFQRQPNGALTVVNCDNASNCASVELEAVEN